MSYAIGHLIYGLPVTEELSGALDDIIPTLEYGTEDLDEAGLHLLYTGSSYYAGYLGEELLEFDVCVDYECFSTLENAKNKLSPSKKEEVVKMFQNFKKEFPELGKLFDDSKLQIGYYIVWSYS